MAEVQEDIREDGEKMITKVHLGGGALALWVRIFQNVVLFFHDNLGGFMKSQMWGKAFKHRSQQSRNCVLLAQFTLKLEISTEKNRNQGKFNPVAIVCT